jgi:hypothetical protein
MYPDTCVTYQPDIGNDFSFELGADLFSRKLMTSLAPKHSVGMG